MRTTWWNKGSLTPVQYIRFMCISEPFQAYFLLEIFLSQRRTEFLLIPIPKMLVDKDDDRNAVCQGGRRKHTVCMVRKSNDDRQYLCH